MISLGDSFEYEIVSMRNWGEPKLKKPKELSGIKPSGSAAFVPKRCSPQFWILGNDIWIKHTDYFSPSFCKQEDLGTPLSYRLSKYGMKPKKEKFVYADCWGDIVLRREAWIKLSNIIPLVGTKIPPRIAHDIVRKMEQYHKWEMYSIDLEWDRFYEEIIKQAEDLLGKSG